MHRCGEAEQRSKPLTHTSPPQASVSGQDGGTGSSPEAAIDALRDDVESALAEASLAQERQQLLQLEVTDLQRVRNELATRLAGGVSKGGATQWARAMVRGRPGGACEGGGEIALGVGVGGGALSKQASQCVSSRLPPHLFCCSHTM